MAFPSNPEIGTVYNTDTYSFSWDGEKWIGIESEYTGLIKISEILNDSEYTDFPDGQGPLTFGLVENRPENFADTADRILRDSGSGLSFNPNTNVLNANKIDIGNEISTPVVDTVDVLAYNSFTYGKIANTGTNSDAGGLLSNNCFLREAFSLANPLALGPGASYPICTIENLDVCSIIEATVTVRFSDNTAGVIRMCSEQITFKNTGINAGDSSYEVEYRGTVNTNVNTIDGSAVNYINAPEAFISAFDNNGSNIIIITNRGPNEIAFDPKTVLEQYVRP